MRCLVDVRQPAPDSRPSSTSQSVLTATAGPKSSLGQPRRVPFLKINGFFGIGIPPLPPVIGVSSDSKHIADYSRPQAPSVKVSCGAPSTRGSVSGFQRVKAFRPLAQGSPEIRAQYRQIAHDDQLHAKALRHQAAVGSFMSCPLFHSISVLPTERCQAPYPSLDP